MPRGASSEALQGRKACRQECLCHLEWCQHLTWRCFVAEAQTLLCLGQHEAHNEESVVVATGKWRKITRAA